MIDPVRYVIGRFRRIFLLATHLGEGPLTKPTAATQA